MSARLASQREPLAERVTRDQARSAERYFAGLVDDYRQAYRGAGRGVFQRLVNRVFRSTAFRERLAIVEALLARHGVADKHVLDLGCGTGAASLAAARLGARVTGVDIVQGMVDAARRDADVAGLADLVVFRVQDITAPYGESADVTLLAGVIEYYADMPAVLTHAAGATRELLIVQDTRGAWWRRALRRAVTRAQQVSLYYRRPDDVSGVMARLGFVETDRIAGRSFTIMAFRRDVRVT